MVWIKDTEGNLRNLDKINHIVKRQSDKFYYINFVGENNYHFEEEFDNEALRDGRFDELEEIVIPKSQYERHKEFVKKCREGK